LSKLLHSPVLDEKVIIGEYRADIEADRAAEKELMTRYKGILITTSVEGRKLVPIQEVVKIDNQLLQEKELAKAAEFGRGHDEGKRKGLAEGHAEAQKVLNNFASLVKDITRQREAIYDEAKKKILDLVLKISKKVTFDAVRIDPEVTSEIIVGAIKKLVDKSKIKVKVHPDHLPLIEQQIERFRGNSTSIKEIIIEADARVKNGGCFIETPTGDIDARVESQMEIVAEALSEVEGQS
jgi:flagellar biosynthesis/type III secretory pathway protein FliH